MKSEQREVCLEQKGENKTKNIRRRKQPRRQPRRKQIGWRKKRQNMSLRRLSLRKRSWLSRVGWSIRGSCKKWQKRKKLKKFLLKYWQHQNNGGKNI